jgi:prepilin-type N-terminal cleavage/methylation domain-containing protein
MKNQNKKGGFTLVEVMVVAVIVAILAAVAIPLMSSNKTRAMATEAEAALGTIRSAFRAMYAETGAYDVDLDGDTLGTGSATNVPGIGPGDLDGRYFSDPCYTITTVNATNYVIQADGGATGNDAPKAADVAGIILTLNAAGDFDRVAGF